MNGSGHHGATGWSGTLAGHDPEPDVTDPLGIRAALDAVEEEVPAAKQFVYDVLTAVGV
jgi:hypothetical protein